MNEDTTTAPRETMPRDSWIARQLFLLKRRRGFLVNPRRQLRAALLVTVPAALLLVVINVLLHLIRIKEMETIIAIAPSLEDVIVGVDPSEALVWILVSVLFLAGVFLLTVFETHRTFGAAVKIRHQMQRVTEGHYDTGLRLRNGDNLRELEEPFDRMTAALRERAAGDAETLEEVADGLQSAEGAKAAVAKLKEKAAEFRSRTKG